jgi:hypothetical protein
VFISIEENKSFQPPDFDLPFDLPSFHRKRSYRPDSSPAPHEIDQLCHDPDDNYFRVGQRSFSGPSKVHFNHEVCGQPPQRSHSAPPPPPSPPPSNREMYGIVGIFNRTGSCYFNSVFQILFHCLPFQKQMFSIQAPSDTPLDALKCLFDDLAKSPVDCSADRMIQALGGHRRSRDASVAFIAIIDLFEKTELFMITLRSNVKWSNDSRVYCDGPRPFVIVAARECNTLSDCLIEFTAPQSVDNFLVDGQPMVVSVTQEFDFISQVLVIKLSRFKNVNQPATQPVRPEEIIEIPVNGNIIKFRLQ